MVSRTCLSPKIQQFVYSAMLPAMLAFSFNGPPVQAQEARTAPALETAIADLSRKLLPSVARITSTIDAEIYSPRRENRSSRPFSPFSPGADIMRQESTGSGVIISPDGYIVTNVHVVDGAQQITVTLADNRSFSADIIGLDRFTEIAVIKIAADKLPYARLGRSSDCRVGDWVVAIGNPMNLHSTVTVGVISALHRTIDIIQDDFALESFIQTDAAINPGNSGGALVNLRGEVIGINTAIATDTGYGMGYGFAIPSDIVRKVSATLIRYGRIIRPYFGIAMLNIDAVQARALGLERPMGVLVDDVFPDSPAARAGLQPLDIILQIDEFAVTRVNALQEYIHQLKPGTGVRVLFLRDGKKHSLRVRLEEISGDPARGKKTARVQTGPRWKHLGLEVRPLTRYDRIELGLRERNGLLITGVKDFSPAEKSGLHIDDVIVRCDRQEVSSPEQLYTLIAGKKTGDVLIVAVRRQDGLYHHFIEIP